jgi:hypothetical protein
MARDERFQLRRRVDVAPEREVRFDVVLERHEARVLESRDLGLGEVVVGEVGERGATPERKGLPEALGGGPVVSVVQRRSAGLPAARTAPRRARRDRRAGCTRADGSTADRALC